MSGVPPPTSVSHRLSATLLVVAIHSILWIVWLLGLYLWMPHFEKIFRELNVKLPRGAEMAAATARWVNAYPLSVGIGLCLFLGVDGQIYYRLRSSVHRVPSELWSAFMILLPAFVIAATAIALLNPLLMMTEALKNELTK